MFNDKLVNEVLLNPIRMGADKLAIISGYASPMMASWHLKKIRELNLAPIDISLTVGMCPEDGLKIDAHEGFKDLITFQADNYSSFSCSYVFQGAAVHAKTYIWLKKENPLCAFTGSANYTQAGFSMTRREYIVPCDPIKAFAFFNQLDPDTIRCNHSEVDDCIILRKNSAVLDLEENPLKIVSDDSLSSVKLSLLTRYDDVGFGSGINWGHRRNGLKRELNQAYIPLSSKIARSGFFPLDQQHFSVLTDDRKQLILRVEQQNDKAITTPLNNSLLGEYLRNRIGVPNGAFVTRSDLVAYGRTDVTFQKLDGEHYFMDFSV